MSVRVLTGDCRETLATLAAGSARCCVSSPPYYGLRDYGHAAQIGLEATPDEYVAALVGVFREVRRVLADDGTLWLNLGDSYASGGRKTRDVTSNNKGNLGSVQAFRPHDGMKPKDMIGIPWRVAFALQADGWWLRSAVVWAKPNPMPSPVRDRPTSSYETIFLLAKAERYFYDTDAIKEPAVSDHPSGNGYDRAERVSIGGRGQREPWDEIGGSRNARDVWTIAPQPFAGAHFAVMPPELAERCIRAGSAPGDTILDPFGGAGTTGLVADRLGRSAVLCEANPEYAEMAACASLAMPRFSRRLHDHPIPAAPVAADAGRTMTDATDLVAEAIALAYRLNNVLDRLWDCCPADTLAPTLDARPDLNLDCSAFLKAAKALAEEIDGIRATHDAAAINGVLAQHLAAEEAA